MRADVWLPIRPGTDVALMLCWIRYIMANKLYDEDFVMRWTNLPYLVNAKTKMMLRASDLDPKGDAKTFTVWDKKTNSPKAIAYPWDDALDPALEGTFEYKGVTYKTGFTMMRERSEPWTLEATGKECRLDPEKIKKAIELYCDGPAGISLGVATDQTPNSVQAAMGAVILNALAGNVERPGALMQRNPTTNVVARRISGNALLVSASQGTAHQTSGQQRTQGAYAVGCCATFGRAASHAHRQTLSDQGLARAFRQQDAAKRQSSELVAGYEER